MAAVDARQAYTEMNYLPNTANPNKGNDFLMEKAQVQTFPVNQKP